MSVIYKYIFLFNINKINTMPPPHPLNKKEISKIFLKSSKKFELWNGFLIGLRKEEKYFSFLSTLICIFASYTG